MTDAAADNATPPLAGRIRAARHRAALTQLQVAYAVHVVPSTIQAWEAGRSEPPAGDLVRLADACACSAAWLLTGAGEP